MRTSTASTIVRHPPTNAPSALTTGRPPDTIAMSVVVPPMSETTKSARPVRKPAPTTLAAGPERIVSTGYSSAIVGFHQRAVTLDDHQRRGDRFGSQYARQRLDQMADLGREARIQRRSERAPRRIQLGAEFVRAGHRLVRERTH